MATNRTLIDAPPERVYEVLADPDSYGYWVVGSSTIRDADPEFPAPGSRFHHTQGFFGVGIKDVTRVVESTPPAHLVLEVYARPLLIGRVTIRLAPVLGGTSVTFEEVPIGGMLDRVPRALVDPPTRLRNSLTLRRLKKLAEGNGRR
jgi:uncharacterized protein YndB with AHSA1/START domain